MAEQLAPQTTENDSDLVRVVVQIDEDANPTVVRRQLKRLGVNPVWANENTQGIWKERMVRSSQWLAGFVKPVPLDELVFSAEVERKEIPALMEKPWIARLDLSPRRVLRADPVDLERPAFERAGVEAPKRNWPLRPSDSNIRGKGATLVIIDSGIDIFHRAMQNADESTRLYAIYDQRGNRANRSGRGPRKTIKSQGTKKYGIDGLYLAEDINEMIRGGREKVSHLPFTQNDRHGTLVASIAAGAEYEIPSDSNHNEGRKFCGVAPEANIIFICCDDNEFEEGSVRSLGYSMSHVMVLRTLAKLAPQEGANLRTMVLNMSFGENLGAHDGTTLLEAQIGEFTRDGRKAGVCVVKSAGNNGDKQGSASAGVPAGGSADLVIKADPSEHSSARSGFSAELWFSSCYALRVSVIDPAGSAAAVLNVEADGEPYVSGSSANGNKAELNAIRYHNDNGDTRVSVRVSRDTSALLDGNWMIRLERLDSNPGAARVDAWLDLLESKVGSFSGATSDRTLTIPGTAEQIITVGAIMNPEDPFSVAPTSSRGPSRDGRPKPELTAPGHAVIGAAARSGSDVRRGYGTSLAAPQVAGAISLLYGMKLDRKEPLPNATQIRAALINSCKGFSGEHRNDSGYGALDIEQFLKEF